MLKDLVEATQLQIITEVLEYSGMVTIAIKPSLKVKDTLKILADKVAASMINEDKLKIYLIALFE
ncbi:hypothetical protein [Amphritea sp. HPY]|uniref:hypothetical protein n=1 Tax=Amphritea sp. HPY TaxID=3421652 RepID=UPI003D7EBB1D